MDAEERDICDYLKSWQGKFVSAREICRKAGGKHKFYKTPEWAMPVLIRLVERGECEVDSTGHYRLRRKEKEKKPKLFLSPEMKKILEKSGKKFEDVIDVEADSGEP